ncbi:MAG: hypothetical protein RMK29_12235 [Myxococcales bacterium]|nr:hypothetical protein [Myxococcota bacterium]MDW8282473.1 hypothetical protein [Myxococcales bacterium]
MTWDQAGRERRVPGDNPEAALQGAMEALRVAMTLVRSVEGATLGPAAVRGLHQALALMEAALEMIEAVDADRRVRRSQAC